MGIMKVPPISDELIKWLTDTNPERCIGRNETLEQAHRRAGTQDLIDKLHFFNSLQNKTDLNETERDILEGDDEEPEGTLSTNPR